ncbi:MAG TPA: hypothetical protein VJ695_01995 [Nitrososphaera sp.]|nr:hypothetical protein [Nitrososphaera sp.]
MNPHSRTNYHKKKNTKATAAIPMAGAVVTAAILLSGLSLVGSFQQSVMAQQENMTGGSGQTGGVTTDNQTTATAGPTQGGNASGGAGGNDSMSQIRLQLEEVRNALQNNDTQGAMMHLELALNALGDAGAAGGNMTGISGGGSNMTTGGGTTAGTTGGDDGILGGIFGGGG